MYFHYLRRECRFRCGKTPFLFSAIYGLSATNRKLIAGASTDFMIEGYPRCANTFTVIAFEKDNPTLKIAHHLHMIVQIKLGLRYGIPMLILIRQPEAAIASLKVREEQLDLGQALEHYIEYYRFIQAHQEKCLIVDFSRIIKDYAAVIQDVNRKFKRNFVATPISKDNKSEIFDAIAELEDIETGGNVFTASLPLSAKQKPKEKAIQELRNNHAELLLKANNLYQEILHLDSEPNTAWVQAQ